MGVAGAPNAYPGCAPNGAPSADDAIPNNADPQPLADVAGTPEFWYAFDVFAAKFWVKLDDADGAPRELNAGAPPNAGAIASRFSAKGETDAVPAGAATSPPIMASTPSAPGPAKATFFLAPSFASR